MEGIKTRGEDVCYNQQSFRGKCPFDRAAGGKKIFKFSTEFGLSPLHVFLVYRRIFFKLYGFCTVDSQNQAKTDKSEPFPEANFSKQT
jgi:hypothetical protein